MRRRGISFRRKARIGYRRPLTYLIMARIPDLDIVSLIRTFPDLVPVRSGESREPHVTIFGPFGLTQDNPPHRLLDRVKAVGTGISYIGLQVGDPLQLNGRKGIAIALSLKPEENLRALYTALVTGIPEETAWCTW